jgi:adenosylcobinamide kinase/adenosylcobinamide-phosphate guanylyltransferase
MNNTLLILGGGRCGKSRYALEVARQYAGNRAFIGTAEPFDEEMKIRIQHHQQEREGFLLTVEEPLKLARAVQSLPGDISVAVIDCLTVWLGNLMHHGPHEPEPFHEVATFLDVLKDPPCSIILVSNEVGMGIVPENAMARRFRDLAGKLNQDIARMAHRVVFMVAGIAMEVKGR